MQLMNRYMAANDEQDSAQKQQQQFSQHQQSSSMSKEATISAGSNLNPKLAYEASLGGSLAKPRVLYNVPPRSNNKNLSHSITGMSAGLGES